MKGVSPVISTVLITAIMLGLVGIAWRWGLPIIEKNMELNKLKEAELFLQNLHDKIEKVAKEGGVEEIRNPLSEIVYIDTKEDKIYFNIQSKGTLYAPGLVCFNRNCADYGNLSEDDYALYGIVNTPLYQKYDMQYFIQPRNLTSDSEIFRVDFVYILENENQEVKVSVNKGETIEIRNLGVEEDNNLTKIIIGFKIK